MLAPNPGMNQLTSRLGDMGNSFRELFNWCSSVAMRSSRRFICRDVVWRTCCAILGVLSDVLLLAPDIIGVNAGLRRLSKMYENKAQRRSTVSMNVGVDIRESRFCCGLKAAFRGCVRASDSISGSPLS